MGQRGNRIWILVRSMQGQRLFLAMHLTKVNRHGFNEGRIGSVRPTNISHERMREKQEAVQLRSSIAEPPQDSGCLERAKDRICEIEETQ
jgi:hypothetical protein